MDTATYWKDNNEYHRRQGDKGSVESNEKLFAEILENTENVQDIIEFGAGSGLNLQAIANVYPEKVLTGVEINENAALDIAADFVITMNALDWDPEEYSTTDLVLTKGFLIHIPPENMYKMYDILYRTSERYILLCEYYNPKPIEIEYRGETGLLWKRDFAGEMMQLYPDLALVKYGFVYHKDEYPQDDITWFLLEKN